MTENRKTALLITVFNFMSKTDHLKHKQLTIIGLGWAWYQELSGQRLALIILDNTQKPNSIIILLFT